MNMYGDRRDKVYWGLVDKVQARANENKDHWIRMMTLKEHGQTVAVIIQTENDFTTTRSHSLI